MVFWPEFHRPRVYHTRAVKEAPDIKWRFSTGNNYVSSPVITNDLIYFQSGSRNLHALDRNSGHEVQKFQSEVEVTTGIAVANGIVYFGGNDRNLYAVDMELSQVKWRFPAKHKIFSLPTFVSLSLGLFR